MTSSWTVLKTSKRKGTLHPNEVEQVGIPEHLILLDDFLSAEDAQNIYDYFVGNVDGLYYMPSNGHLYALSTIWIRLHLGRVHGLDPRWSDIFKMVTGVEVRKSWLPS